MGSLFCVGIRDIKRAIRLAFQNIPASGHSSVKSGGINIVGIRGIWGSPPVTAPPKEQPGGRAFLRWDP